MAPIFTAVKVSHRFLGNTAIAWKLAGAVPGSLSATFSIEWARTGAGPWHKCDSAIVYSSGYALDTRQRLFGQDIDLFYRVKMAVTDGAYYSQSSRVGAYMPDAGQAELEYVYDALLLNYDRDTNFDISPGCLFKRRHWGPKCKTCLSPRSGEITQNNCPECFGTGITGGYYPPVSLALKIDPRTKTYNYNGQKAGAWITTKRSAKGIAYPVPVNERDLWFNVQTGEFMLIADESPVVASTQLGNVVLEQQFAFDIIPASENVYTLDFSACADLSLLPNGTQCEPWEDEGVTCDTPVPVEEEEVLEDAPLPPDDEEEPREESGDKVDWGD